MASTYRDCMEAVFFFKRILQDAMFLQALDSVGSHGPKRMIRGDTSSAALLSRPGHYDTDSATTL